MPPPSGPMQQWADLAKRDTRAAGREVRRSLAEVADMELVLTGGRLGTSLAVEGMVELLPAVSPSYAQI